jgi:hypothetical protein
LNRADKIQYAAYSKDSVLDIANGYAIDKGSKFRFQQVEIEIQVPIGKKIRFDRSIPEKLNPSNFEIRKRYRSRTTINGHVIKDYSYNDDYFRFIPNVDYVMGIDGSLRDPAGNLIDKNNYNRYEPPVNDSLNTEQQLQEEKRKREESDRKIRDLEKKQKDIKQKTGAIRSIRNNYNDIASTASSIYPLERMLN